LCAGLFSGIHFFTKSSAGVLRFGLFCLRVYDCYVIKRLPKRKGREMKRFAFIFSLNGNVGNTIVEATSEAKAIAKFKADKVGATILIISTGMRA
jgi:hypothetical protein